MEVKVQEQQWWWGLELVSAKKHFRIHGGPGHWKFTMNGFLLERPAGGVHSQPFTVDPYYLPKTPKPLTVRVNWCLQLLGRVGNNPEGERLMFFALDEIFFPPSQSGLIGEFDTVRRTGKFRIATAEESAILRMMSFGAGHPNF